MRDYPEALRSVVLDSVVPLEVHLLGADAINADHALDIIFQRCLEEALCNEAFPDLPGTLDELAELLDKNPVTIKVTHLIRNKEYDVYVNRSILGWSMVEALYNFETAVFLPKLIYETHRGEDEDYPMLATSLRVQRQPHSS